MPMSSKFLTESTGEKIVKIGQYLAKIWTKYDSLLFFGPPCISDQIALKQICIVAWCQLDVEEHHGTVMCHHDSDTMVLYKAVFMFMFNVYTFTRDVEKWIGFLTSVCGNEKVFLSCLQKLAQ